MWIRKLLTETGTMDGNDSCDMRVNNEGCMSLAQNQNLNERTKHIEIKFNFVLGKIKDGTIVLRYVSTKMNAPDILTKILPRAEQNSNQSMLGMACAE